ncbi:unnamed protein product [Arabidopsis arenosa]|uniref:Glycosyl transferase family 1 domain-containing protein n=1 Tax=Arabidopsis arenosa TaxID=38785 RepID=A0A8S2A213_ARAAE|nr:unnamed protein product [Arabidopsis arenosa]
MREKHSLQDRVEMLGAVPHSRVRSILFFKEAFCIAILEAATCRLLTVNTHVGGVPEAFLPNDMVVLAEPNPDDMLRAIEKAISILPSINPEEMHNQMKKLYSWEDVAKRTEIVYDRALKCSNRNLLERLSRYISVNLTLSFYFNTNEYLIFCKFLSCGAWAGKLFCMVMILDNLLWRLLQYCR